MGPDNNAEFYRKGYEIVARRKIAQHFKVRPGDVEVDIIPLSPDRVSDPSTIRVQYRVYHGGRLTRGLEPYVDVESGSIMKSIEEMREGLEKGELDNRQTTFSGKRTLDEMLQICQTDRESVAGKIANMFSQTSGLAENFPKIKALGKKYPVSKQDIKLIDYEPKLIFEIHEGKPLRVKYSVDFHGLVMENWVSVGEL